MQNEVDGEYACRQELLADPMLGERIRERMRQLEVEV